MSEPWFNPNAYAWIPGTLLGVAGGILGALVGTFAPQGRGQRWIMGLFGTLLACSALLLAAGVVALLSGQPYGVWYGLGLPGVIGLIVFGNLLPVIRRVYRQAEERRMQAQDAPLGKNG